MRDALLRAAAASDQFTTAMDSGNKAFEENNALQAEAEKRYATVESQLGIMRNRINDAAIDLGSVFLPVVSDAAAGIGDFADGIAGLPEPLRNAIAEGGLAVGMIALLGGTALIAVPKVVEFVGTVRNLTAANTLMGSGLRGTARFLTGPWGIALVAAAAGALVLQNHIESLKTSTEEWGNVIKNANSADDLFAAATKGPRIFDHLDEATQDVDSFKTAIENLDATGMWGTFNQGASSLRPVLADVGKALAETAQTDVPAAQKSFRLLAEQYNLTGDEQLMLLNLMGPYKDALYEVADAQGVNVTTGTEAENSTNLLKLAMGEGEKQSKSAARAYIDAADGASELRKDLDQLIDVMNEANGIGQDANSANIDYQNTLRDVGEQIKNVKDGVEGFGKGIDAASQAGADNRDMLVGLAEDSQKAADAQFSLDGNAQAYYERLKEGRQRLIDSALAMGASEEAAKALADQIYQIPSEKEIQIIADTKAAQLQIDSYIDANTGREIIVKIGTSRVGQGAGGSGGITQADGGVIESYANGGVREQHVAQMARAGAWRVWAEPETGGESYIPHAASKRGRSEQILAETASLFGGQYIPAGAQQFADGGVVGAGAPSLNAPITINGSGLSAAEVRSLIREEFRTVMGSVFGGR
jgi:hypothetical protein